jgi:hypothetical protein
MSTEKKDSDAIVDISEIKKGEPVSLFIIQVAAPSWAATQLPEITLASQSCLKTGFLKAVQVEHSVMIGSCRFDRSFFVLGCRVFKLPKHASTELGLVL